MDPRSTGFLICTIFLAVVAVAMFFMPDMTAPAIMVAVFAAIGFLVRHKYKKSEKK